MGGKLSTKNYNTYRVKIEMHSWIARVSCKHFTYPIVSNEVEVWQNEGKLIIFSRSSHTFFSAEQISRVYCRPQFLFDRIVGVLQQTLMEYIINEHGNIIMSRRTLKEGNAILHNYLKTTYGCWIDLFATTAFFLMKCVYMYINFMIETVHLLSHRVWPRKGSEEDSK